MEIFFTALILIIILLGILSFTKWFDIFYDVIVKKQEKLKEDSDHKINNIRNTTKENKNLMEKVYINDDQTIKFEISGVNYLPESTLLKLKSMDLYEEVKLKPDPNNKYDPDAIKVCTPDGVMIGYVNSDALEIIHELLNSGVYYECKICRISDHKNPYIWVLVDHDEFKEGSENEYGEDLLFINKLYNIPDNDQDATPIEHIRSDDDDNIEELELLLSKKKIKSDAELLNWYNDLVPKREYTTKYLKQRISKKAKEYNLNFK
ncbi:MAG: HIRAN domain-containing protein [Prevotella sp.]|jgi:hypothetical protein|nr:HIRAN domain-containing protein [Prevotella sp.]